jgi:hypothetical protein
MKRLIMVAMVTLFAASSAFAADKTWTGKVSDSMCGLSHKAMVEHGGGKMTAAQCTEACVKAGAKYVFTSKGKVYALANQDFKDIAMNAGKTVRLTGDMQGTTITVSKMTMPAKKKAAAKKS